MKHKESPTHVQEATQWLQEGSPALIQGLMDFGKKARLGYEKQIDPELEALYRSHHLFVPSWERVSTDPEDFTGAGLCVFASAAIEVAIREKFDDKVPVVGVDFTTQRIQPIPTQPVFLYHTTPVIGVPEEGVFADLVYRQFDHSQPVGCPVIEPYTNHPAYYTYKQDLQLPDDVRMNGVNQPVAPIAQSRGELLRTVYTRLQQGIFPGVEPKDFTSLVTTLLNTPL